MTAKDKAIELVEDMYNVDFGMEWEMAKQCALFCVDEIRESTSKNLIQSMHFIKYWQEVKNEINKL